MRASAILLYEHSGVWATALRSAGLSALIQSRSLAELREQLQQFPAAVVCCEVQPPQVELMCQLLLEIGREFPHVATVLLLDKQLPEIAPWLREFGVSAIFTTRLQATELAAFALSQLERNTIDTENVVDQILNQLDS